MGGRQSGRPRAEDRPARAHLLVAAWRRRTERQGRDRLPRAGGGPLHRQDGRISLRAGAGARDGRPNRRGSPPNAGPAAQALPQGGQGEDRGRDRKGPGQAPGRRDREDHRPKPDAEGRVRLLFRRSLRGLRKRATGRDLAP